MAIVTSRCNITVCWEAADVSPVIMQVGRASVIRMWLGPPKGRYGEYTRRKGSSGCRAGHLGERIKPWCGKGLRVRPGKQ